MKQLTLFCALILSYAVNYAQIISDKKVESKPKPVRTHVKDTFSDRKGENWLFLGAGYQVASHRLESNTNAFGKPLGMRADEKMENQLTVQLGIRNRFHKFFTIEAGLLLDRYGQLYTFNAQSTDSSYHYVRNYTFIAVPVQLYFTAGNSFQFMLGVGLQPEIPVKMKLETTIGDSLGNQSTTTVNKKESLNPIGISFLASGGFQYHITNQFGVYLLPSYIMGLSNIYTKQQPHKEWLDGFNVKFGISFSPDLFSAGRKKTGS